MAGMRLRFFHSILIEQLVYILLFVPIKILLQANAYPWIAALLRDEDTEADYINSKCAAVLVTLYFPAVLDFFNLFFNQIGNRFVLTAAHCLYDDDNEEVLKDYRFLVFNDFVCFLECFFSQRFVCEVLPATFFSIMLGLHDRRKAKEPNRWLLP